MSHRLIQKLREVRNENVDYEENNVALVDAHPALNKYLARIDDNDVPI